MKVKKITFLYLLLVTISHGYAQKRSNYIESLPSVEVELNMIAIPSGSFLMGSPENEFGRNDDEGPIHNVSIDGFWVSKFEVTWELYNLFVEKALNNREIKDKGTEVNLNPDAISGATIPYVDMSLGMGLDKDFPAVNITQMAASKFCEWLSSITGHYYRLPTEEEWEYIARAGSNQSYFFESNDPSKLDEYAWFSNNSDGSYHKVGLKKPNPWGLYDIYGNVAEWTLDQYNSNGYLNSNTPFELSINEYPVVVRGGSFKDKAQHLRSASRLASDPIWKQRDPQFPRSKWWFTNAEFVGFRVVRPYASPSPEEYYQYWIKN